MNITKQLTESKVVLNDASSIHLSDLSSDNLILAWNRDTGFETATLRETFTNFSDEIYIFQAGDKTVNLAPNHGFWLENGEEIKATDVVVNQTQVWVKVNDSTELRTIDSKTRIQGAFITYDVIGSSLRNYVLNDFILHNFDPEDYSLTRAIGENNQEIEAGSDTWADMSSTARATRDAYLKALNEFILSNVEFAVRWTDTALQADILATVETDLGPAIETMIIRQSRFFNSLVPALDQETGLVSPGGSRIGYTGWSEQVETPNFSVASLQQGSVNFDIDYTGSTTFSPTLWTEHVQATKDFQATVKRVFAKLLDVRTPENNYSGVTPPYGFADPIVVA